MQLDIFADSRSVMLRNDALDALLNHDAAATERATQTLAGEFADDDSLPLLATLTEALKARSSAPFDSHEALAAAREALQALEPAALRLFGDPTGHAWLRPWHIALAERAATLPFRADRADDHAAALWLAVGDASAAMAAASRIESWRRIPAPLAWMAEARCRAQGLDGAWPLLAELAWLAPARLDAVMRRLHDPVLDKLRARFDAGFEVDVDGADDHPLAWFPAWVLTETPALARWLGAAQPSLHNAPERGMRLMLELLHLEKQGRHHDLVQRRRQLRDLQPALCAAYLRTR